jgi:16S rRNA (cytosine967-C5)-methyltransferase
MQAAPSTSAPLHLHALDDAAVDALHKAGVDVEPIAGLARVFRAQGGGFFQSAPFKARRVIAQDAASVAVGRWLGAEADDLVADICAGRGGKSWSLASTGAEVTAFDLSADKLAAARQLVARSGNKLMATIVADLGPRGDPNSLDALAGGFDKVLVDAPCTGLGTLRRRPEIRHRRRAADVCANASLQRAILDRAAALVRPGGILLYAVCSMTDEEGGSTVQRFLEKHPDFARAPTDGAWIADALDSHGDLRSHPMWHGSDAFYAARLRRND